MPMSTEEALEVIKKAKETNSANDESKVESTPSVEETKETSKSEDTNASSNEDKVESKPNDTKAETTTNEDKGSDEPKSDNVEVKNETEPKSKFPEMSKRDYAFIREKQKRKEQKQKYEARIKELEEELQKKSGLKPEYFTDPNGNPNPSAYVNWKFKERDMQDEIHNLKQQNEYEQRQYDLERDRILTERCFQDPNELREYNEMIAKNGKAFAEAVSERDPNGVVFSYLESLNEYPIVLKELMDLNKNPRLLQRVFRSTDPDSLKHNIAVVADEILESRYKPQAISNPTPVQETKPAIPVIGKQITNNSTTVIPTVKDRNYWNNYLKNHKR